MRRLSLFFIILMLLLGSSIAQAQQVADSDGDGLPDTRDKCPNEPGPLENDGCPYIVIVTDSDGDGIPNTDDECPNEPGPRENRGCPEEEEVKDSDGDGINDKRDECPNVPGTREHKGCPPPDAPPTGDSDGDGLNDNDDACPFVAGLVDNKGCPPEDKTPEPPPFTPPALPIDGCYITPAGDYRVNVRELPDMNANSLGHLLPGKVYEAQGYVVVGTELWFVLTTYENSVNIPGYALRNVVLASPCTELPFQDSSTPTIPTDFEVREPLVLCHLTVGFDAPTWATDPAMESVIYAAFWFESEPGMPLMAGSKAWGVIHKQDFINIPDADNVFAVAPSQAVYEEALNSGAPNTYNWPTLAGGIVSDGVQMYRLTTDMNKGACGPIVAIDDFAQPSDEDTTERRTRQMEFARSFNICEDDLGVWWIKMPDPYGDPFEYHDIGQGLCEDTLETVLNQDLEVGSAKLIAGRGRGPADPNDDFDCDGNLVPDLIQFPVPDCADPLDLTIGDSGTDTRDKELASWWAKVLDLTCGGGGWLMITEIDEDGDEIVTDVACDD